MTLMDYGWDNETRDASVVLEDTRWGYRISEGAQDGWRYQLARGAMMALTLGLIGSAGMIWTLEPAIFPWDPTVARIFLSAALLVISAAMVGSGIFARSADVLEVDIKGRVLKLRQTGGRLGQPVTAKTVRFEEITRIDLAETTLMSELKSALSRWDYGRITVRMHGKRPMTILTGDMVELEPLLRRLRGDTGVA